MIKHSKKRNVGLLTEFFARHIANLLVSQRHGAIDKATKLYKKFFLENTEISKEWALFHTLHSTNVSSPEVALGLVKKVREVCEKNTINPQKLEEEKTRLVHEINNTLGDREFFSRSIPDFKVQATIQVLLNNWSQKWLCESLGEVAHLEDTLVEHLTRQKVQPQGNSSYLQMTNEQIDEEIDGLVVGLMSEKFNTKFSKELSPEQREIISSYVFATQEQEARTRLAGLLEGVRSRTMLLVETTLATKKAGTEDVSEALVKKLNGVRNLLLSEYRDTSRLSDESISFFMTLTTLERELASS